MIITSITFRTDYKTEAIKLFENDENESYYVYRSSDKIGWCEILIDFSKGKRVEVDYEYLKTLTDNEILYVFYPKANWEKSNER